MEYRDDVMPYKKKAKPKPSNKSDHRHLYKQCILEYPRDWWQKKHLRGEEITPVFRSYCTVCGKLSTADIDRWYGSILGGNPHKVIPTPEAERELDPRTRTLPTFCGADPFEKYIQV